MDNSNFDRRRSEQETTTANYFYLWTNSTALEMGGSSPQFKFTKSMKSDFWGWGLSVRPLYVTCVISVYPEHRGIAQLGYIPTWTNGVGTNAVTANFTTFIFPLTYLYLPKSARVYLSPLCQNS